MANPFSEVFILEVVPKNLFLEKRILEVGSAYYSWESVQHVFQGCSEFISVDLQQRFNTTHVLNAEQLISFFGAESFDFLISFFMIEHVVDWKKIISNFKRVLKPGGVLIISSCCCDTPYHSDFDAWRFESDDFHKIFCDFESHVLNIVTEPGSGFLNIYLKAVKPFDFVEQDLSDYRLYNINSQERI